MIKTFKNLQNLNKTETVDHNIFTLILNSVIFNVIFLSSEYISLKNKKKY